MKYKLVVFDMDGVVFESDNFWYELHKAFGTYEKGKEYTEKYLRTDYPKLVELVVVGLWKGKPAKVYFEVVNSQKYLLGVKETFKELKKRGYKTAIITSGPTHLAQRAQKDLGVDYIYSNELVIKDDAISGKFNWPIGDNNKVPFLKEICEKEHIDLNEVVAVGHDENDIGKAHIVGLSIAINCKSEELKNVADVVIEKKDLREILKYI